MHFEILVLLSVTPCFLGKIFIRSTLLCRLSEAQAWGGTPPPGSASLHLGLLMVPPLRGWGGPQLIRAKRAAT